MSGIGLLQPDVCEVQLAHEHVQLHHLEVLGHPEVQILPRRRSVWSSLCFVIVYLQSDFKIRLQVNSIKPKHTQKVAKTQKDIYLGF